MQRKQVIDRREASETSYDNSSDLLVFIEVNLGFH